MRRLIIIIVAGALALALAERFGPGGVQRRGLKAAEAFRRHVMGEFATDGRFSSIDISVGTNLTFLVHGEVPDVNALRDLRRIAAPPPDAPFRTVLDVSVATTATTR